LRDGDAIRRRHLPTRPQRPRDKAAVEAGVRFAQSYILGRLRNVTFFSLAECNTAIAVAAERMNSREMRRLGMSRRQLFEAIERPVMQSLPDDDFEFAEWRLACVGIDYDGTLDRIHHALYVRCRELAEREPSPTAAIIDSQSVKSVEKGAPYRPSGFDVGKKINGKKRHVLVDTQGLCSAPSSMPPTFRTATAA
jgi:hypothetical protein